MENNVHNCNGHTVSIVALNFLSIISIASIASEDNVRWQHRTAPRTRLVSDRIKDSWTDMNPH